MNLFLKNRLFAGLGISSVLFLLSFFFPWLGTIPLLFFLTLLALVAVDFLLLYRIDNGIFARRDSPDRLSNGDDNNLGIHIESFYSFPIGAGIIDEIPFQFQQRNCFKPGEKERQNEQYRRNPQSCKQAVLQEKVYIKLVEKCFQGFGLSAFIILVFQFSELFE